MVKRQHDSIYRWDAWHVHDRLRTNKMRDLQRNTYIRNTIQYETHTRMPQDYWTLGIMYFGLL